MSKHQELPFSHVVLRCSLETFQTIWKCLENNKAALLSKPPPYNTADDGDRDGHFSLVLPPKHFSWGKSQDVTASATTATAVDFWSGLPKALLEPYPKACVECAITPAHQMNKVQKFLHIPLQSALERGA